MFFFSFGIKSVVVCVMITEEWNQLFVWVNDARSWECWYQERTDESCPFLYVFHL